LYRIPAAYGSEEVADDPVLVVREVTMLYVWPQIVEPTQPAALAAPLQPCNNAILLNYVIITCFLRYIVVADRDKKIKKQASMKHATLLAELLHWLPAL
jgi:hypothetical protein